MKKQRNKLPAFTSIKCLHCKTCITSRFRHDFQTCLCIDIKKRIFIDGGLDYTRFGHGVKSKWAVCNDKHTTRETF
mgnify:CR=1 FL=1